MRYGCLTRPWNNLSVEECFDGVAAAGYDCIGLLGRKEGPIVGGETAPEEVDRIKSMLADRGLEPIVCWSRAGVDTDLFKRELDNIQRLGAGILLHCGVSKEEQYEDFYQLLRDGADHAKGLGLQVALKPHGGITTYAEDCLKALEKVDRDNFVIWYDPGNIKYYSNTNPVEDVKKLADKVTGCCVKDCTGSHPTGDGKVMLTPGDGEVDLAKVFRIMVDAGYDGPNMVECISGETPEELVREATKTKERMLGWFER